MQIILNLLQLKGDPRRDIGLWYNRLGAHRDIAAAPAAWHLGGFDIRNHAKIFRIDDVRIPLIGGQISAKLVSKHRYNLKPRLRCCRAEQQNPNNRVRAIKSFFWSVDSVYISLSGQNG